MSFPRDKVAEQVERALAGLAAGVAARDLETKHVDFKTERGARDARGDMLQPKRENEAAAQQLAAEVACMANTDGGGALILGVEDDGAVTGTALDAEWLRRRIYELTDRRLTVDVSEVYVHRVRLLVVRAPQAIEPIRHRGRITWRVDDRCVEVDATTWHDRRLVRERYDWSEQASQLDVSAARPVALEIARRFLRDAGDDRSLDLASVSDQQMLRRLNVVTTEGTLTNAGALAFVGRGEPALDYTRRRHRAGDSQRRVRDHGRSLLEEIAEIEKAADAHNETRHVPHGFVIGQFRELPPRAVREAVVNGVVHRDWATPAPTTVEHVGRALVVTSPGGFVGGVTPENIITHPSEPRNKALAELCAVLRLTERQGVGVDRMYADMVRMGYPPPDFSELPGPYVRVALVGEEIDEAWIRFLLRLEPRRASDDVDVLLVLRRLVEHAWVDVDVARPLLQLGPAETAGVMARMLGITIDDEQVVAPVAGVPAGLPPAWRLSAPASAALAALDSAVGRGRPTPSRSAIALDWARGRGRVSTSELAGVVGAQATNLSPVLRALEESGQLVASRPHRAGRGFFYRPVLVERPDVVSG